MKYRHSIVAAMACVWTLSVGASPPDADLDRVSRQMKESIQRVAPSADLRRVLPKTALNHSPERAVELIMRTLGEDGKWPDLDYADQTRGWWSPSFHIKRVLEMARAYTTPDHKLHANPELGRATRLAFDTWLANDYQCPNWWHNLIGVPRDVASVMLLLEGELTDKEKADGLKIVSRATIRMTGQNKMWLSGITMARAILENDAALFHKAREAALEQIAVSTGEGIQPDFSFHQHGPQLQLGNYGLGFAADGVRLMEILRGTRFAVDSEKADTLRHYLTEGEGTVFWKGAMDISCCGRQLMPGSPRTKYNSYVQLMESMKRSDPSHVAEYDAVLESVSGKRPLQGNKLFWRSDYMVDRRAGYYASIKMSSPRVVGSELINGENLLGYYLGDGALYVSQSGLEFEDVFPVWDWRKLPGVTCAQEEGPIPPSVKTLETQNSALFVGGVSDGKNGAAVLSYSRRGVSAKKSVFFFEGQIVCLGADIHSTTDAPVTTSVAQCHLRNPLIVAEENAAPRESKERQTYSHLRWAFHDGLGYIFLQPASITVGSASQSGSWKEVFSSGSPDPVSQEIFALWIDHGKRPQDGSYSYVLLPGTTAEAVRQYADAPSAKILSNTARLQAVKCGDIVMAIFHQPGTLKDGVDIVVDHPCALMLRPGGGEPDLTVADPTQMLSSLTVSIGGKRTVITLPSGAEAGRSISLPKSSGGASSELPNH